VIENEQQYQVTQKQALKFAEALLDALESPRMGRMHRLLWLARRDALRFQLRDLLTELVEYEERRGQ